MTTLTSSASHEMRERYRPGDGIYARAFGSEVVLLDFGRGEYFGLGEVGALVWRGLEAGRSVHEIVSDVVAEFDAPEGVVLADVRALLQELEESALIRPA